MTTGPRLFIPEPTLVTIIQFSVFSVIHAEFAHTSPNFRVLLETGTTKQSKRHFPGDKSMSNSNYTHRRVTVFQIMRKIILFGFVLLLATVGGNNTSTTTPQPQTQGRRPSIWSKTVHHLRRGHYRYTYSSTNIKRITKNHPQETVFTEEHRNAASFVVRRGDPVPQ